MALVVWQCFIATTTGYWIYDQFDGRWGRIGLTQINTPIWWQGLHRLVNTTLFGAIVLAVISGRQMQGNWLLL